MIVAGCGSSATPEPTVAQPSVQASAGAGQASPASNAASLVPGNSALAPLPTDAPAAVRGLSKLPSCGGEILFEQDPDISPIPTAPGPTTDPSANTQATDCLMSAWSNKAPAELDTSLISDEADQIYTIYRLPGDGTVDVITRVWSHTDKTVTWTQATCQQLSVQDGAVTPADCQTETPIN